MRADVKISIEFRRGARVQTETRAEWAGGASADGIAAAGERRTIVCKVDGF